MKKIIAFLFTVLMILQFNIVSFAAELPTVYSDDITLSENEKTLIPVYIKNNTGIMGFKFTINYPSDKLDVKAVTKGDVIKKGSFNTNLGAKNGEFDVLWSNTSQIKDDGTVFTLTVDALGDFDSCNIYISYSAPDTFDEKYNDVSLSCKDIKILKSSSNDISEKTAESDTSQPANNDDIVYDNSQVINSVDLALKQLNYKNLDAVKNEKLFLKVFNENLQKITGNKNASLNSFEELKSLYYSAYEGFFIENVSDNIDSNVINIAVENSLKKVNADKISNIKNKDKNKFVKSVLQEMQRYDNDVPDISNDVTDDKAVDIIEKIYTPQNKSDSNTQNHKFIIPLCIVFGLALAVIIAIFIKKRKLRQE